MANLLSERSVQQTPVRPPTIPEQPSKTTRKQTESKFREPSLLKKAKFSPEHIANCGVAKPHANNNRIERLNGTLRERTKVQRGWKSMKSAIAEGQRIHYNHVKPHMALEGKTPSEVTGLNVRGWKDLLNQAVRHTNP